MSKNELGNFTFRHTSSFGKRIEHWIIGKMLKDGLDVYIPLVDDFGIDAIIRRPDGTFIEVQIKARSNDVIFGDAALFSAITHTPRNNYYFIFYSERLDKTWLMSSEEFLLESACNKHGKNLGKRSIWFNGKRKNKETQISEEYPFPKFEKYLITTFDKLNGVIISDTPEN